MCADEFGYETSMLVRVYDLGCMKHVNNAVYATYMEQAWVEYFEYILDVGLDELEMATVTSHMGFERQVHHDAELTVQM